MAPSNPRTTTTQKQSSNGTVLTPASAPDNAEPTVNRKKQKRRQKQAAKLAAEQALSTEAPTFRSQNENGHLHAHTTYEQGGSMHSHDAESIEYDPSDTEDPYEPQDGEELFYSEDEDNHYGPPHSANGKPKRKKKSKSRSNSQQDYHSAYPHHPLPARLHPPPPPPPPPLDDAAVRSAHSVSKDRIWNTSTQEERERIKQFWLSLEEIERRSLVKVEKEAVLKKMKEQQKDSCSCSVCGRKRIAIREELEVLYDAYYDELEQYANHQQITLDTRPHMIPPPRSYPPVTRLPQHHEPHMGIPHASNSHQIAESYGEEDDVEDDAYSYDDEKSEDDYYPSEPAKGPAADFFNFGNSLTVQGGILTVADDLLKNDGKKFIEMMEQLAERRMQREEEAQYRAAGLGHSSMAGHNHGPPLDEEEYEDEDDEDYASEDDEDYDEDEMEAMTEEQRMEEGRRMFQIFAARMFEQRVLTAYREKVARERQEKLLEELADEDRIGVQREAKKAKEAQKKKDKKKQQKAAKEEEKMKREAEKAAEEAAAKAIEEQKLEEQRQRKEEQRKKREAEKKSQEEERLKKEKDKQRKIQEAKEQQAELERKQREQKEKEKKKKEDVKLKDKAEREAREKEKKEREAAEKRDREAKAKAEKEAHDRAKKENIVKAPSQTLPPPIPPLLRKNTSTAVPIPPGLGPVSSAHASPHLQIATPAIPKAPTPMRPRQASHQESQHSSPKSAQPVGSLATSPSSSTPQQQSVGSLPTPIKLPPLQATSHQPLAQTSLPSIAPPPGMNSFPYAGMSSPGMAGPGFPASYGPMIPGIMPRAPNTHDASIYAHQPFSAPPYRGYAGPNSMPFPPGMNGVRPMLPGRGSPVDAPMPQAPIGTGIPSSNLPSSHSRHASASFEKNVFDPSAMQPQPIARPAPIQRPSSLPQHEGQENDTDDLDSHLGSSALLEGTDEPLQANLGDVRGNMAPGFARPSRLGFGGSPMFPEPIGSGKIENFPRGPPSGNMWGAPPMPFGTPTLPHQPPWSSASGPGWSTNSAFGAVGHSRHASRPVAIRILACQACRQLSNMGPNKSGSEYGFHDIDAIMRQIQLLNPAKDLFNGQELLDICDTEGNAQNGGGSFVVQLDHTRGGLPLVKHIPDTVPPNGRVAPGDIGSPIIGSAMPFGMGRGFQPPGGGIPAPSGF